ncbi:hypothetical protein Tco_0860016 [Tanacetum coccineum]|uniref:Uncharacterized protein n=1 Tax=Tanacetum coccineum TaxID=301880 RepID=A0ABQ5BHP1_9ASTR
MNPVAAQQVALDNALVAPEKRLKIERCNARIEFSKPQREETYQVTLDALKLSPCYPAFLITAECDMLSAIHTDQMHQPWRTFAAIINRCISGMTTGLDRHRESRTQILWGYVGIKSLLDAVRITAAQVYVNTSLMKLVMLMNFTKNILSSYYCWYKS